MGILELILIVLNAKGIYDFLKKYSALSQKEKDVWLTLFDSVSYQPWLYLAAAADLVFPAIVASNFFVQVLSSTVAGVLLGGGLGGLILKQKGKVYY